MALSPNLTAAYTLNNGGSTIDVHSKWTKLSDSISSAGGGLYLCVWTVGSASNRIAPAGTEQYRLCLTWDTDGYEEAMLDVVDGLGSASPAGTANLKTKSFVSGLFAIPDAKNVFAWVYGGAADSAIDVSILFYKVSDIALAATLATKIPQNIPFVSIGGTQTPQSALAGIIGTALSETSAGYLAAAFKKFLDVAAPGFTAASVNQTGDGFARLGAPAGASVSADVAALLAAIQNVQNGTFVGSNIPYAVEKPDAGSETLQIVVTFADETGAAKNLDSGDPAVTLVNAAGTDRSGRLGSWGNPSTGKYTIDYTNSASDDVEMLLWEITGTVNTKLRRYVMMTQIVDTTAVDFTSADRTKLEAIHTKLPSKSYLTGTANSDGDLELNEVTGALTATAVDSLWDEVSLVGLVDDASATATEFDTDLDEASDDHYNDMLVLFTSGVLSGQSRPVSDYNGTSRTITVSPAFTEAPGNGDAFRLVPLWFAKGLDNTARIIASAAYNATNDNTITVVAHVERNGVAADATAMTAKVYDANDVEKVDLGAGTGPSTRKTWTWSDTGNTWVTAGSAYYVVVIATVDGVSVTSPPRYINT